jgi:hypothetical protein
MNDRIQFIEPAAAKSHFGEARPIQSAIFANNLRTEYLDDLVIYPMPGLHQLPAQFVGLNDVRAKFAQVA